MIADLAARVWPDGVTAIEPLGGGITNHNYKVTVAGEQFVLRIGGNDTELLGIDRDVEQDASLAAAELGVGPEVVAFLEPEGYLVTRFIEGTVGDPDPAQAARLLRRFHDGRPIAGRFDVFRVVETYAEIAGRRGPDWAHALAARIEEHLGVRPLAPCHNDLLPANFIYDGERTWIVDWEYAGMGDPAFDFANFAVNNGVPIADDDPPEHVLMRFMSDLREAMWGVVQQAVSQLDFDFKGYADEHFERLERTAGEARFRALIDTTTSA